MKPKFIYIIETKKLFKPKFDDEYASNFSYQGFTSRFLLDFHLNPFQINVDSSLFCFSNYTFKLKSFLWLYFTKMEHRLESALILLLSVTLPGLRLVFLEVC